MARLTIHWGDGHVVRLKAGAHRLAHAYRRPGRYRVTIVIVDRAGNQTAVVRRLEIKKRQPPHQPRGTGR